MPKLFAKNRIIRPDGTVVEPHRVFDATPEQARQFDHLNAAQPAREDEIKAAKSA